MSDIWDAAGDALNKAELAVLGEPITYIPMLDGQEGTPIVTRAMLLQPTVDQSLSPGYFADIEVDPAIIPRPARKDLIVWADGTVYVVAKIVPNRPYSMFTLAIHLQSDPPEV